MAKRISGWGICVSPFVVFLFVVVCAVDLPFYMTTGVNVDVILNCFFTCKDRASERDRPYQRKKKALLSAHVCHEQSLQTNNSWLLILHVRHEQVLGILCRVVVTYDEPST
jgi:hypothetical protein